MRDAFPPIFTWSADGVFRSSLFKDLNNSEILLIEANIFPETEQKQMTVPWFNLLDVLTLLGWCSGWQCNNGLTVHPQALGLQSDVTLTKSKNRLVSCWNIFQICRKILSYLGQWLRMWIDFSEQWFGKWHCSEEAVVKDVEVSFSLAKHWVFLILLVWVLPPKYCR